ncbi:MAG: hypothetical protein V1648_03245 [Candidatus Aenigmatarchaeota archaeon]
MNKFVLSFDKKADAPPSIPNLGYADSKGIMTVYFQLEDNAIIADSKASAAIEHSIAERIIINFLRGGGYIEM